MHREIWQFASSPPDEGSVVQATDFERVFPAKWTGEEWLDLSSELVNDPVDDVIMWAPLLPLPDIKKLLMYES